jgi:hypothetical protein
LADNLKKRYESNKRIGGEPVHVSDLVPSSCIRKHYYERKFTTKSVFSDDDVFRFIRGESSERVITELADVGAAQVKIMRDGITARPDILRRGGTVTANDYLVIELKDNATLGKRLEPSDEVFTGYLHQLLYYLVMTDIENGILCIKYSVPELIWYLRDGEVDHYLRPSSGKGPGIESWSIYLSHNDPLREEIKDEMSKRKDAFLEALTMNRPELLPRLIGLDKRIKCRCVTLIMSIIMHISH